MNEVIGLGYVVITAQDVEAWSEFAQSILGLQLGNPPDGDDPQTVYLRSDERSWRLGVEAGRDRGTAALGLEVADRRSFESLQQRLSAGGVAVTEAPDLAARRRVLGLFTAQDPNGLALEFFYGAKTDKEHFVSPRGARFVTGPQGFGHAVLLVGDVEETYRFYVDVLGFGVRDLIHMGPMTLTFTSPNQRHHSLAFGGAPGMRATLAHIMVEVDSIDAVGRALDRVYDTGVALQSGLGRHTNDHMISFYCVSPSGLPVEYGWGGLQVDGTTHSIGNYDAPSFWGHRNPDGSDPMAGGAPRQRPAT